MEGWERWTPYTDVHDLLILIPSHFGYSYILAFAGYGDRK